MGNILSHAVAYILGLASGVIFYPLIKAALDKLFRKNA